MIASRRQLLAWTIAGAATPTCICCPPSPAQAAEVSSWGYVGPEAVQKWPGVCIKGKEQSPIDIPQPSVSNSHSSPFGVFRPRYPRFVKDGATVRNNGHGSPQINFPPGFNLEIGDRTYSLVQLHFHASSEHALGSQHAPMECHLVHQDLKTKEVVVVAILLNIGSQNPVLQAALESAPAAPGQDVPLKKAISLLSLLPRPVGPAGGRRYATYEGSLTTPPCTERVRWFVLLDDSDVSAQQVLDFMAFGSNTGSLQLNARPEQPVNGRSIEYAV